MRPENPPSRAVAVHVREKGTQSAVTIIAVVAIIVGAARAIRSAIGGLR